MSEMFVSSASKQQAVKAAQNQVYAAKPEVALKHDELPAPDWTCPGCRANNRAKSRRTDDAGALPQSQM